MQLHHFNTPSVTHTFIQCFYLDITLHTWSTGVTSWFSILLNGASDHWWEEPSIQPSNQPQLPPKDRKNNARILTADKKQSTATWRLTRDLRMTTDDPKKGDRNIYTLRVFKKVETFLVVHFHLCVFIIFLFQHDSASVCEASVQHGVEKNWTCSDKALTLTI